MKITNFILLCLSTTLVSVESQSNSSSEKIYVRTFHQYFGTNPKYPWLIANDGVIASADTPLYLAVKGANGVQFMKYTNVLKTIADYDVDLKKAAIPGTDRFEEPKFDKLNEQTSGTNYPDILYPEILVVISYDHYKIFNFDLYKIIPYVLAYWNGVDMMYRAIENPKYRLNIAGIVLETEEGLLTYLSNRQSSGCLSYDAIYTAPYFWYQQKNQIPLSSYDAAITMTTYASCSITNSEVGLHRQVAPGIARVAGGICEDNHNEQYTNKVAFVQDFGKYSTISTAAHELGHLLGAYHDGFQDGTNNSNSCKFGNIMGNSEFVIHASNFQWSSCSLKYFQSLAVTEKIRCLRNKPVTSGGVLPRYLPGKMLSLKEQCSSKPAELAPCPKPDLLHICQVMSCDTSKHCRHLQKMPAVGTPCGEEGEDKICIQGACVTESNLQFTSRRKESSGDY